MVCLISSERSSYRSGFDFDDGSSATARSSGQLQTRSMIAEVSLCLWFVSIRGLLAQSSYDRYFSNDNEPQPFVAAPAPVPPPVPDARGSVLSPGAPTAVDEPASIDVVVADYGGMGQVPPMSPLGALSVLAPGFTNRDPHLDFCRRCPACVACTGMRINPQVRPDSIFLAAFAGPRKHSANLQDLANFALQEHMRKFGLSPLTISVADCRVRSSAFRGYVKLCECAGPRAPEFQLAVNNLGRVFQLYRKHLAVICDHSLCEISGFLPRGCISYSFQSARKEYEIPFPDRFPVRIQLEWAVRDQQNVMVYSIKRRTVLDLIRKASLATKKIPNSEFMHRVLANLVEKKFDSCYRFRDIRDISEGSRSVFREPSLGDSGFRDASLGDSIFRDGGFKDVGFGESAFRDRDRPRDYDFGRDRMPLPGDYTPLNRDRQDKSRPSGPIYTEL